jgi:hypothetical protein
VHQEAVRTFRVPPAINDFIQDIFAGGAFELPDLTSSISSSPSTGQKNAPRLFINGILNALSQNLIFPVVVFEPTFIEHRSEIKEALVNEVFGSNAVIPLKSIVSEWTIRSNSKKAKKSFSNATSIFSAICMGLIVLLLKVDQAIYYYIVDPRKLNSSFSLLDVVNLVNTYVAASSAFVTSTSKADHQLVLRPGRKRFCDEHPEFLSMVARYFSSASVDPRLAKDVLYKSANCSLNRCLLFLASVLGEGTPIPSRSMLYTYLLPRRAGTFESRRHSDCALNIRTVLPS